MKITKLSNYVGFDISKPEGYIRMVDNDLVNIFNFAKGRIRLGEAADGSRGENISGEYQIFTSGAAGTTTIVTHTLGANPTGFIVTDKSGFGDVYMATTSNAVITFATLATASTSYTVFLFK